MHSRTSKDQRAAVLAKMKRTLSPFTNSQLMLTSFHSSDVQACERILGIAPEWQAVEPAAAALDLRGRVLLHAGPPITDRARMARPVFNSAVMAVLFEGWARNDEDAEALILSPDVCLEPAQDHHCVVPLADVLSPSMFVQRVADRANPAHVAFSPLNGGMQHITRTGQRSPEILQQLHWLHDELGPVLARAVCLPVPLIGIADLALHAGDDCHGRTANGTALLLEKLAPALGAGDAEQRCLNFLQASPSFFLNLWMAATKCMLRCAEGMPGASIVTAIGGNGIEFGVQLAGLPGRWFTAPSTPPLIPDATSHMRVCSLGAIGDSAVVDAFGLGAMALNHSPELAKALHPVFPPAAHELPGRLLMTMHPGFAHSKLQTILAARRAAELDTAPMISLGVLDKWGVEGRLGGGMYQPPARVFAKACAELEGL